MPINSNPFQVGGVPLDRSKFNAETFGKLAEAAAGVPIAENKPAAEWKELADRIEKNDTVSKEDLDAFKDLSKAAKPERSKLRKQLAQSGYKDEKIKARLTEFYVFDGPFSKLTEALRLGQARVAVEALVSSSFGPMNVVTAYHAYAALKEEPLRELIGSIDAHEAGKATNLHPGNKVEQVHHEQVWEAMNDLLDKGVESAKNGKNVEVDAQYYEFTSQDLVGKLAENAAAGNKVRINVDPGRLVAYNSGDPISVDDYPDKMRTILQVGQMDGDVAISTYPVTKLLGDPNDLMHRKGLRVGDTFLLSGMNANSGSGENIDAGYLIEGPAARKLVQNFSRDVQASKSVPTEEIYGEKALAAFPESEVQIGRRGLVALMDALHGPSPAGTPLEKPANFEEFQKYAESKGFDLAKFIDVPAGELEGAVNEMIHGERGKVSLTAFGKQQVLELGERAMAVTRTPENLRRLDDISLPKGEPQGTTAVALADLPTERETELIMAIQNAEKFIYVPAFVMTRPVAAALVAKNNEMKAQGKDFDVKVIADPGIYPDGGTPNEDGIRMLEDGGIEARWALLPRCGWHDRKIHAKELLTDKSEFFGSTNFSKKGLRENWEHSGVVHFKDDDPAALQEREEAKAFFEDLWENFSYECNSIKLASLWKKNYEGPDKEYQIEDARFGVIRKILKGVDAWEIESGKWMEDQMQAPRVQARMAELISGGMDEMSAAHVAVRETLGDKEYFGALRGLDSYQELKKLAPRRSAAEE